MELPMIFSRKTEQPCGYGGRIWVGEISDHIHLPGSNDLVDQLLGYGLDPRAQSLYSARCECRRTDVAQARVLGAIHEHHLPPHDLSKWLHDRQFEAVEKLFGGSAVSGTIHQNRKGLRVAGHYPRVHIRIPMDRVITAQVVIMSEWIG